MVRLRRRRRRATSGGWGKTVFLTLCASVVLALGAGVVAAGRVVFAAAAELPPASSLERLFGPVGSERFRAPQLFDRTGEALLAEILHPLARERQWATVARLPDAIPQATIAALDPSFWTNAGYDPASVFQRMAVDLGTKPGGITPTITGAWRNRRWSVALASRFWLTIRAATQATCP
jgi:membrane peptidoglycan carboxypeptidase